MNHLLDECPYRSEVWEWVAGIFRQSNRIRGNISATINTWKENYSENEEVNLYWTLIPGMIIWEMWKEQNQRIFKNQLWTAGNIKGTIIAMTREMVQSHNCQTRGVQLTDWDLRILEAFQLKGGHKPNQVRWFPQLQLGEHNWKPPPEGSLKLNVDGASKGNPRRTGTGGVIRDSQ
jgi:hypothetical protein